MSATLATIQAFLADGKSRVSDHAFEELYKDGIITQDVLDAMPTAILVEDYPDANRGSSVLVLCRLANGRALHAVWGIHKSNPNLCVLVTAYIPDPLQWTIDLLRRTKP